jgi:hypothetical protein
MHQRLLVIVVVFILPMRERQGQNQGKYQDRAQKRQE